MILHATLVAAWRSGAWRGLLVRGPSGAGKSGIALRLMQQDWRLVADDRVIVWRSGEILFGRAPDPLSGLIEARGVGVRRAPTLAMAEILHVIDAAPNDAPLERTPDAAFVEIAGVRRPCLALDLHAPTAPAAAALWCCGAGGV